MGAAQARKENFLKKVFFELSKTLKQTYCIFRKVFEGVQRELFSKSSLCKKASERTEAFSFIKREYRGLLRYSEEEY